MALNLKGVVGETQVTRESEGADKYLRMLKDGTVSIADWVAMLGLEGRCFGVNVGSVATPATFGAGALAATEFDLHVSVPSTVYIIPLSIRLKMAAFGTDAIFEAMACYGTGSTTGAGTTSTVYNLNRRSSLVTACTVTQEATATSGVAITGTEFWRDGIQKAITQATAATTIVQLQTFKWSFAEEGILHVVAPSGQLGMFAASEAGTGYIIFKWAEIPV